MTQTQTLLNMRINFRKTLIEGFQAKANENYGELAKGEYYKALISRRVNLVLYPDCSANKHGWLWASKALCN